MPRRTLRDELAEVRSELFYTKIDRDTYLNQIDHLGRVYGDALKNLEELGKATQGVVPIFKRQGNIVICTLMDPFSERVYVGAAVCNIQDVFDMEIGKAISLGRAMNDRANYFADHAVARTERNA